MKACEQPNYTAILHDLLAEDESFGLPKIDWGDFSNLATEKTELIKLFNSYFNLREIGAETVGRWYILLQKRYDEIKRDYDHRFKVIQENQSRVDDLGRTVETVKEYGMKNKTTFQDTPVTPLEGDEYASSITDDVKGGMDKETVTDNTEMYIKKMNTLIKEYNDVRLSFVKEFEVCFMSTMMRV